MSDPDRTVLVTGNCGYIGVPLTQFLQSQGYRVIGLDSMLYAGCECSPVEDGPQRQLTKDVRDVGEEDLAGVGAVIHLAGLSNDPLGDLAEKLTDEINHEASVRLARMAKRAGVERFIFSSSCSVYGISRGDRALREDDDVNPATTYARSKVRVEEDVARLKDERFHPVFLRNATVYGFSACLRLDLVVNNLVAWAFLTGRVRVLSDGSPWRPLIHVRDLCGFIHAVLQAPVEKTSSQVLNIGTDEGNYTVRQIAETVCQAMPGSTLEILNQASPDQRSYRVDFGKARAVLASFRPQWDLHRGVVELFEAYERSALTRHDLDSQKYSRLGRVNALLRARRLTSELRWVEVGN